MPEKATSNPALIIFDKDGTLIDFHAMWVAWARELARRLEAVAGLPLSDGLYRAMDFDPASGRIAPGGPLAVAPAADLRVLTLDVLQTAGLSPQAAAAALEAAWYLPDPATLARPLTDLRRLFGALRSHGIKIAIATSDDRAPTETMLAELGLDSLVDAIVCADDGLAHKPAPAMVLTLCQRLNVPPAKTIVVGDNVVDMQMGRAAGAGLVIGVLSGLGSAEDLGPQADRVIASVDQLVSGSQPPVLRIVQCV